MKYVVFVLLLVGLISCNYGEMTPNSEDTAVNVEQTVDLRSTDENISPGNPTDTAILEGLCIGCGCERAYKKCKKSTVNSCYELHPDDPEKQKECCNKDRRECHECDGAWLAVCVRWKFKEAPIDSIQTQLLDVFLETHGEGSLPSEVEDVIDKYQSGVPLTDTDFETIDDLIIIE